MMSYINETDFVIENKELVYPEIITDGLQLYYDAKGKRDTDYHRDTMLDMSGNKNHGKLQNFAYEKHSGYKDGLVFDYIDDKLVRPTLILKPNDFTFMLNGNIISFSPDGTVKRVQDGEVIESKVLNMLYDMEDTSQFALDVKHSYNHAEARWLDNISSNTFLYSTSKYNYKDKHKYYISYNAKPDGNVRLRIYANQRYLDGDILNPIINEYNFRSGIVEAESKYSNTFNVRLMFDATSVIGTKVEVKDLTMIDLTETFGAGNEPTKEQMDEIVQRFGFIPNAQDLIDRIEYKGNDLGDMENIIDGLYKTEILSGEEIYTDKSDDSVVHVEVDGKSVGGGSGKNILYNSNFMYDYTDWQRIGETTIVDDAHFGKVSKTEISGPTNQGLIQSTNPDGRIVDGKTYAVSVWLKSDNGASVSVAIDGGGTQNGYTFNLTSQWKRYEFVRTSSGSNNQFRIYSLSESGNFYVANVQVEESTRVSPYELSVPTPDYPIEIHSLHDFDVVSSVGKRNYVLNSDREISSSGTLLMVPINNVERLYPLIGKTITISLDIRADEPIEGIDFYLRNNSNSSIISGSQSPKFNVSESFERFSHSFELVDITELTNISFTIRGGAGVLKHIQNIKLEKGHVSTDWTPVPEDIIEDENHPLIDKINILLDEPLRSIGDVKDRLFRDSDGVWKVGRNTAIYISDGSEIWRQWEQYSNGHRYDMATVMPQSASENRENTLSTHFIADGRLNNTDGVHSTWISSRSPRVVHFGINSPDELQSWFKSEYENDTPVTWVYEISEPYTEILDQELQDKLNNLRSFSESNYVYTVDRSTNLLDTVPLLNNHWYPHSGAQQNPVSSSGQTATEDAIPVYPGAKIRLTKVNAGDNYWRIVWVDKDNNVILRITPTDNDLILTAPNGAYGMRASYSNGAKPVITFDKSNISPYLSENLKPTLHAKFLYNNWYKEDRVINNLMIYNRTLTNEEMLQNYKTIKRRWGM